MLFPKKVKFRKWQNMRRNPTRGVKVETRGTTLVFGAYGLKALTPARIKATQIEAARKAMARMLKKSGRVWVRIFPDRPYTAKPPEVGMGKGKGDPQGFIFEVGPGRVLFELDGVTDEVARETLGLAADKLPVVSKIITRS